MVCSTYLSLGDCARRLLPSFILSMTAQEGGSGICRSAPRSPPWPARIASTVATADQSTERWTRRMVRLDGPLLSLGAVVCPEGSSRVRPAAGLVFVQRPAEPFPGSCVHEMDITSPDSFLHPILDECLSERAHPPFPKRALGSSLQSPSLQGASTRRLPWGISSG